MMTLIRTVQTNKSKPLKETPGTGLQLNDLEFHSPNG